VQDPARYPWTSYRANALGQPDSLLSPHPLYLALGRSGADRQTAYRGLLRDHLDQEAIADIRLALNQSQPLGNTRFHAGVEQMTGIRHEPKPRGRPRSTDVQSELA